jgi:formylglycine-generating enzyme required for sulfatase activity
MKLTIRREQRKAQFYPEALENGVTLDMVLIPGGSFQMGSPKEELERSSSESPQHLVTVPTFFMGKYAVTQAQWQAVSTLPKVDCDLKPDPSRFKGKDRPVEQISWDKATEFCKRLARQTGRPYRLPSESEWEYACRAGTTTPFYFGETITTDLANYNGNYTYSSAPKGTYQEETTPVGSFPANGFGLYDMHGNVWEWCADQWHNDYENAPNNGSAWIDETLSEQTSYVLRGGSWLNLPWNCRSATRNDDVAGRRDSNFGFRVVCSASRTP